MNKGKLVFLPKGYRVVPEEPTVEQIKKFKYLRDNYWVSPKEIISDVIKAAPQLTTPPVLRWEGDELFVANAYLANIMNLEAHGSGAGFWWSCIKGKQGYVDTEQEARRAAEKALGLPEIEEV